MADQTTGSSRSPCRSCRARSPQAAPQIEHLEHPHRAGWPGQLVAGQQRRREPLLTAGRPVQRLQCARHVGRHHRLVPARLWRQRVARRSTTSTPATRRRVPAITGTGSSATNFVVDHGVQVTPASNAGYYAELRARRQHALRHQYVEARRAPSSAPTAANTLTGTSGNDPINGGPGNDTISGGVGVGLAVSWEAAKNFT